MIKLNLIAKNKQEELILTYLQENVSETLADKINNGTPLEKDGHNLLNKKTLAGFMKYACEEARKLVEKGANSACIDDATVYGWAIHYFEEESIEATLYTVDGEEYKPVVKTTVKQSPAQVKPIQKNNQPSLFDMISENADDSASLPDSDSDKPSEEDLTEAQAALAEETDSPKPLSPVYVKYKNLEKEYAGRIVLYRLGDFYEVLGDNAVILSDKLNLTLTGREVGLPERIPMIGFPFHAKDVYFPKITKLGFKLAVYENTETQELSDSKIDYDTGEILKETAPQSNQLIEALRTVLGNTFEVIL